MNDLRILGLMVASAVFSLYGCIAPSFQPSLVGRPPEHPSERPPVPPPVVTTASNDPIRKAAAEEVGPEAAASIPETTRKIRQPTDPAAKALVDSILTSLPSRDARTDETITISLNQLRNQSRCGGGEFQGFRERMAKLLSDTANDPRLQFTADSNGDAEYALQGAAYLATVQGFDVWELYLSLSPTANPWTIWQADNPVRVLRQPRPGQSQFMP